MDKEVSQVGSWARKVISKKANTSSKSFPDLTEKQILQKMQKFYKLLDPKYLHTLNYSSEHIISVAEKIRSNYDLKTLGYNLQRRESLAKALSFNESEVATRVLEGIIKDYEDSLNS